MSSSPEVASKVQTELPWAELCAIVGAEHLRAAAPADDVDGLQPRMVIDPGSAEEVAQILRCATASGLAVIPRGGSTKLKWGNLPRKADLILSTLRLNRVLEHAWADMTAAVEAGCTVEKFQQALAAHGQRLALDPLWPGRATIGGVLAANDSGTLRVRFGSLRDLIIGATLALPDGTLARSGGKVVKNVAGYDLQKLATGSLGTLGVITQAIFRLYPLPHETRSTTFRANSAEALNRLALSIQDSWLAFTGLQLRVMSVGSAELDVRFEGTVAGIKAQLDHLSELAQGVGQTETPPGAWMAREALWSDCQDLPIAKFSLLPNQLGAFCDLLQRVLSPLGLAWKVVAQSLGVGFLQLEGQNEDRLIPALAALRDELAPWHGSLVALRCPPSWKSRFDVWGPAGDDVQLARRIKEQLDPSGTLNPGRFVGGI